MVPDFAAEYNNRAKVPHFMEIVGAWQSESHAFRAAVPPVTGPLYGPSERCRYDLFTPAQDRGGTVVMFIHGGYWQMLDRSTMSHCARGVVMQGLPVAVVGYDLCPTVPLATIIEELRAACITLHRETGRKVVVTGHSAGGHLAAMMLATRWQEIDPALPADLVPAAQGVSGLYDLVPLILAPANGGLRLTPPEAARLAPVSLMPPRGRRIDLVVGGDEGSEYHRQSGLLRDLWTAGGVDCRYLSLPGKHHFDVVESLAEPDGLLTQRLLALLD